MTGVQMHVTQAVIIPIPNLCVSFFFQTLLPLPSFLLCEMTCLGNSSTLILCLEKLRDSYTLFCFPVWYLTWCNRVYTSEPKGARTPTSRLRYCEITAFQAEAASPKAVKKVNRTQPAALGKHSVRGREKMKKWENVIFSSLTLKIWLVSVNTI